MVAPARQPDLLALFLDPDLPSLPALALRANLPLRDLINRLLDPAFQALLETAEALEDLRTRILSFHTRRLALNALANIARTGTNPVEVRRAATTLLQAGPIPRDRLPRGFSADDGPGRSRRTQSTPPTRPLTAPALCTEATSAHPEPSPSPRTISSPSAHRGGVTPSAHDRPASSSPTPISATSRHARPDPPTPARRQAAPGARSSAVSRLLAAAGTAASVASHPLDSGERAHSGPDPPGPGLTVSPSGGCPDQRGDAARRRRPTPITPPSASSAVTPGAGIAHVLPWPPK